MLDHFIGDFKENIEQPSLHSEVVVAVLIPLRLRLHDLNRRHNDLIRVNLRLKPLAILPPGLNSLLIDKLTPRPFDPLLKLVSHGRITDTLKELDALLPLKSLELPVVHEEGQFVLA